MTIRVQYEASENYRQISFTPGDFGLTEEEWKLKSDAEKRIMFEEAATETPYWAVTSFNENE